MSEFLEFLFLNSCCFEPNIDVAILGKEESSPMGVVFSFADATSRSVTP